MSKMSKEAQNPFKHVFAHIFLNIQQIFNSEKSFEKLRLRAFQPYHQILCILKHIQDVKDYIKDTLKNIFISQKAC